MIKERYRKQAGPLKNLYLGSIMEWGSVDETLLSETDIYRIAITKFSKRIDIVECATADPRVCHEMRKYCFTHHGEAHIVLKDKTKEYTDAGDIEKWRIRFGYSDVILT